MNTPLRSNPIHPKAREGIDQFNQGNFYEAHEPLEEAWMETDPPERILYQGILQIGLAYYQIFRNNYRGALKMFLRGQRHLSGLGDVFLGIDVKQILEDAQSVESALRRLGPEHMDQLDRTLIKPVLEIQ